MPSLYSSFAVLYSFQMRNLLKGIGQQMKWSVRDESLHSKMGCQLFRHMTEEYPDLKTQVKDDVIRAAQLMVEMEHKFIDKMFEMGNLENLNKEDLKNFINKRANEKIAELGYAEGPFMEYNEESANELPFPTPVRPPGSESPATASRLPTSRTIRSRSGDPMRSIPGFSSSAEGSTC